jgi:dTDP-4-amino-4,6-dideoxygalactose transaminase
VDAVEDATTKSTGGVLPVHVYGNPCDVEGFQEWSTRYARPVIYDAAHAFGVEVAGRSVLASGDASTLSFHATKLFHTAEGGAVAAMDEKVLAGLRLLRNNGIRAEYDHVGEGTNAKLSELHAAMGLANLEHTGERLRCRAAVAQWYKQGLPSNLQRPRCDASRPNNAYMPVVMASEDQLLRTVKALHAQGIRPRRYFYPLTSDPSAWSATPVASDIAPRALCLPMYASLSQADVERICAIVRDVA